MLPVLLVIICGYLLGSIPFGVLISKIKKVDIRKTGSGNIGATNAMRALGPAVGISVLLLDLFKGYLAVLIAIYFTTDPWVITLAGIAAFIGHLFPIFIGFKGGKGSAVGLGVLLGITPKIFLLAIIWVLIVILLTRYVSAASITGPFIVLVTMIFTNQPLPYILITIIATIFILVKHKSNIGRLLSGTEHKISFKKSHGA